MVTGSILRYLLLSLFLSIFTSNLIVSAIPTPHEQPWTPKSNDRNLVQHAQTLTHPKPDLHPSLLRRHKQFLSLVNHLSPSTPHAKRSLTSGLVMAGTAAVRIIFDDFDIIFATGLEHFQMQAFYSKLHYDFGMETGIMLNSGITVVYGLLKLAVTYRLPQAFHEAGLVRVDAAKVLVLQAMIAFLGVMSELHHQVVMLPYRCWLRIEEAGEEIWVGIQLLVQGDDPTKRIGANV
ncbi:MAG: hypothetical protein Q9226_003018 [Calogaya cf. arnoldii]